MKILILGGTGFAGRILTENLIASGELPVLFNRGKLNPGIFPGLRKIIGDRESDDILKIGKEDWDAVVDFYGLYPESAELIANILKGRTSRYIFISSASVYNMDDERKMKEPINEEFEVLSCSEEQRKDKDIRSSYGEKKAEIERILLACGWLDTIIFRPALIYGRYDPSDRFYYWLYRVKYNSEILLPDNGMMNITNTYSVDYARLIEQALTIKSHNSVYNAVTHDPVSLKEYLDVASELLCTYPEYVNAPADFFTNYKVQPWAEIPMWLGGADLVLDSTKMKKDFGIKFKTFKKSVEECIEYYSTLGWKVPKYGISLNREAELIKKFKDNNPV